VATTIPTPGPQQPISDAEARMRVFQTIGSDIDGTWSGDWHQALKTASARWTQPTADTPHPRTCWFCGSDDNPPTYTVCGFCHHHRDDAPTAA
jgi:hypothetical protein